MKTRVTVEVPYKRAGNVINNKLVDFEVEEKNGVYKAIPKLSADELRVANLPPELIYTIQNGKGVTDRGIKEGNQHVVDSIILLLKESAQY